MNHNQAHEWLSVYKELTPEQRRQVDEHLRHCDECAYQQRANERVDYALAVVTQHQLQTAARFTPIRAPRPAPAPLFLGQKAAAWLDNALDRWLHPPQWAVQWGRVAVSLLLVSGLWLCFARAPLLEIGKRGMPASSNNSTPALGVTSGPTPTAAPVFVTVVPAEPKTIIKFACHTPGCSWYQEMAVAFQRQHPSIRVVIENKEDFDQLFRAGATSPPLAKIANTVDTGEWLGVLEGFNQSDNIHDLTPLLRSDPELLPADFYPAAQRYLEGEHVWALPAQFVPLLIAYDKNAFDEVGVAYPKGDWTLENFFTTMQRVTVQKGEETLRYGFIDKTNLGVAFGHSLFVLGQLDSFTQSMQGAGLLTIDKAALTGAVQRYTDLWLVDKAMPNPIFYTEPAQSRSAMWTEPLNEHSTKSLATDVEIGLAPLPLELRSAVAPWFGTSYYMSESTQHRNEVWLWLKFLIQQRSPFFIHPPTLRRLIDDAYWARLGWDPHEIEAAKTALEQAGTPIDHYPMILIGSLNTAIEAVLKGRPVDKALANIQPQIDLALRVWKAQQDTARFLAARQQLATVCLITSPQEDAVISETVTIYGVATRAQFREYQLFYAAADNPEERIYFDGGYQSTTEPGSLGALATATLPDGDYLIQLRVVDAAGNYGPDCAVRVSVKNGQK